ncbi:MAG: AMP-binding protein, partial [bacterium]|nr:AMP-binding protein [bacterium]
LARAKLPEYMVPWRFVLLPAMPLTSNGKLDRRALPAPTTERSERLATREAPRTPVEEILAGIFAEVLGCQRIGRHGHFFELGGHSLLATQVASRVRRSLQLELPVRCLFESPTVAQLAAAVDALRHQGMKRSPPLVARPRQEERPLSFAQERLWFLDQLESASAAYNIAAAGRLDGLLDCGALEGALREIVHRHETLRTALVSTGGRPQLRIRGEADLELPLIDLGALPAARARAQARHLANREAVRPFDLSTDRLLRVILVRLSSREHVLIRIFHHIVSDGWSLGIFHRELTRLYEAFSQHRPSPLPELTIQYPDFASWQRRWFATGALEPQLAYWRQQLAAAAPLELPTDRPRPSIPSYRGATHPVAVEQEPAIALRRSSLKADATLFMTLLAAFMALLSRLAGQRDVVVGSPIANRNQEEIEGLIGFFVNSLVLRAHLDGNPSFAELRRRVRQLALEAYGHQDLPFEQLVEELQPQRDPSRNPFFQITCALHNAPVSEIDFPGLVGSSVEIDHRRVRFDLELHLWESSVEAEAGGLKGCVVYSTDLFDGVTIRRWMEHFDTVLHAVTADDALTLAQLPLLRFAQRHQLLHGWNDNRVDLPGPRGLHQLFEAQAARTPDAGAVVWEEGELSYRCLNRRANHLAVSLRARGVGPDSRVAICLDPDPALVVGLLAVLKAGGGYVPLDPSYPSQRL